MEVDGERGHRRVAHTADVIVEAWAPDVVGCLEEAVAGLVSVYAEGDALDSRAGPVVHLPAAPAEKLLRELLDEVVFLLDTGDGVPVGAEAGRSDDGGVDVRVRMAPAEQVGGTGSVPKAIARSQLTVVEAPGRVSCRFLVDV